MKIIKRIILFLAIIISVLWIEAVHADMSAPEIREFGIVVVNPNGVDYYDYKGNVEGHLNKDEMVIVLYEYDGKYTIGSTEVSSYGQHEILGYIYNLDDFSIVTEEVDPTKLEDDKTITKYDTPQLARVYSEDGVDMYAGPSSVYKKVGHIKNGTLLTYKYSTQGTHIYVEYDSVKGWIEILKGKVLIQNNTQYIFSKDISTECGTIPRNSITTPTYKTDRWTHKTIFEYNGCEFIYDTFRDDYVYSFYTFSGTTTKEVKLYEYADSTSNVVATIPSGSEIMVLASKDSLGADEYVYYIKYEDKTGWFIGTENFYNYNNAVEEEEQPVIDDTIEIEEPKVDEVLPNNNNNSTVIKKIGLVELIILCSMGGILLVITAVVIIILINKTKKNKEIVVEEPKKEK